MNNLVPHEPETYTVEFSFKEQIKKLQEDIHDLLNQVIDCKIKLNYANQCYEEQWKYTRQLDLTIRAMSQRSLSSEDFDILTDFAKELKP